MKLRRARFLSTGVHDPPARLGNVRALEHHFLRLGVVLPAAARFEIHGTELPLLQRIVDTAENRKYCSSSVIENQYFNSLMPERTSMRSNSGTERKNSSYSSARAEPHDLLDARTVVPAAVEQDDFAGCGEVRHIALEIPLRAFADRWAPAAPPRGKPAD